MARVKKSGRALTGILCFIFGFIFAIIVEVAAIAAGIYYLLKSDIDDIFSTVGIENTDEDGNKIYINTDLEELTTIQDLVTALGTISSDFSSGTLTVGELAGYFPVIGTLTDAIFDSLEDRLSGYISEDTFEEIFNKEEFLDTPVSELTTYLYNSITGINLLGLVGDVYTDDTILAYMIYGVSGIQEAAEVKEVTTEEGQTVGTLTATYHCLDEDCEDYDSESAHTHGVTVEVDLDTYETVTETNESGGETTTKTGYLITDIYYTTDDGEKVEAITEMSQLSGRISGVLNDLTIGDIVDINEDNTVLYALRNSTISSIAEDIQALTVQEIFTEAIYGVTEGEGDEATTTVTLYEVVAPNSNVDDNTKEIAFDSSYLYYHKDSDDNLTLAGDEGHLDSFDESEGTLYTYGKPQGAWKLLLYADGVEVAYTINEVSAMQSNLAGNIGSATISDLCDMGILSVDDSYLNTDISISDGSPSETKKLGDFTLSEYFDYTLSLITTLGNGAGE